MASRACAQISADALAVFVTESFPKISADHNRLAKLMNAAIDGDEHDGYEPVKFPIVGDGTAADTDKEEQEPQPRKRSRASSRSKGKRAKTGKTSRAPQVAESSVLEPELRGVLWSTGTIADPETEAVAMVAPEPDSLLSVSPTIANTEFLATLANQDTTADAIAAPEPESRDESFLLPLSPTITNTEVFDPQRLTASPVVHIFLGHDSVQNETEVAAPVPNVTDALVSRDESLTLQLPSTIANAETIYPSNASPAPPLLEPLEDSMGNAQGDTQLFAPALGSPSLISGNIDDTVAEAPGDLEATHGTAGTINNFGIDPADMPALWDDSLWTHGNWVDGLEVIDALPAAWFSS
jgi:hypothetical protein